MLAYKKITKSGGLTIPRMARQELGIHAGTAVDIATDENGIRITKHVPTCFNCGSVDGVAACMGLEVCRKCAEELWKEFEADGKK